MPVDNPDMVNSEIEKAIDAIKQARSLLVLTGAGLSVASGLSTYRGSTGIYTDKFKNSDPADISHINTLKKNPQLFWEFQHSRLSLFDARPNKGHEALAEIEKLFKKQNKSFFLITQNIDNLHRLAGSENIIEIHGNFNRMRCMNANCGKNNIPTLDYFNNHPNVVIPKCPDCDSNLRPNVLLFGEAYDTKTIDIIKDKTKYHTDVLLCVGTSFYISSPISTLPRLLKGYSESALVIEQNLEATHVTKQFTDIFLKGKSEEILVQIIEGLQS